MRGVEWRFHLLIQATGTARNTEETKHPNINVLNFDDSSQDEGSFNIWKDDSYGVIHQKQCDSGGKTGTYKAQMNAYGAVPQNYTLSTTYTGELKSIITTKDKLSKSINTKSTGLRFNDHSSIIGFGAEEEKSKFSSGDYAQNNKDNLSSFKRMRPLLSERSSGNSLDTRK